jgi:hypothetical protein
MAIQLDEVTVRTVVCYPPPLAKFNTLASVLDFTRPPRLISMMVLLFNFRRAGCLPDPNFEDSFSGFLIGNRLAIAVFRTAAVHQTHIVALLPLS